MVFTVLTVLPFCFFQGSTKTYPLMILICYYPEGSKQAWLARCRVVQHCQLCLFQKSSAVVRFRPGYSLFLIKPHSHLTMASQSSKKPVLIQHNKRYSPVQPPAQHIFPLPIDTVKLFENFFTMPNLFIIL